MFKLPDENLELTDEIKNEILSLKGPHKAFKNVFKNYGKYFHQFEDILKKSENPVAEILHILKHGRPEPCKYGEYPSMSIKHGYRQFCSLNECICKKENYVSRSKKAKATSIDKFGVEHAMKLEEYKDKLKNTMIEKYGVDNFTKTDVFSDKVKETSIIKYGVEHHMKTNESKEKIKKTNLEKYGVDHVNKLPEFADKLKKTSIEKYGTDHFSKTNEFADKITTHYIEKYGVRYGFQVDEIKDKIRTTNIEKYGVENYSMTDEYKDKVRTTNIEKYGVTSYSMTDEYKDKMKKHNNEKYGVDWYYNSDDFKIKSKAKITELYGVDHPMQSTLIKDKVKTTNIEKYGVDHPNKKNFSDIGKQAINDPVILQEYVNDYTVYELQELFGCESTAIYSYINKYNLTIPFRTGSSYESILSEILTENGIDHIRQDRSVIPPLEIDIYIPSANLAIEINGLYWHSVKFKDKNYHYNKWKSCHDKGIQLLSIMEDEFIERPNTWISKILHICNQSKYRIHARKCDIVELDKDDVYEFVEKYHLQGFVVSQHYYGAYYGNELVAMMSFTNTRNNKEIQMNRFCLKNGVVISGIANRLLKSYVNDHGIDEIVTYSDNRYSNGGIYRQMGFEMMNEVKPDFQYIKGIKRFHKANFRKSSIASKFGIDMSYKTEKDAMEELGFLRIYDCGKIKWKWSKKVLDT
jgi:hypothetical protein